MRISLLIAFALLTSGCVARTIVDVVTLPVKAAGKVVDVATTSQSESDRNRGRAARKEEERQEKERRRAEKQAREEAKDDD
jgi:hypothetical protein